MLSPSNESLFDQHITWCNYSRKEIKDVLQHFNFYDFNFFPLQINVKGSYLKIIVMMLGIILTRNLFSFRQMFVTTNANAIFCLEVIKILKLKCESSSPQELPFGVLKYFQLNLSPVVSKVIMLTLQIYTVLYLVKQLILPPLCLQDSRMENGTPASRDNIWYVF